MLCLPQLRSGQHTCIEESTVLVAIDIDLSFPSVAQPPPICDFAATERDSPWACASPGSRTATIVPGTTSLVGVRVNSSARLTKRIAIQVCLF